MIYALRVITVMALLALGVVLAMLVPFVINWAMGMPDGFIYAGFALALLALFYCKAIHMVDTADRKKRMKERG